MLTNHCTVISESQSIGCYVPCKQRENPIICLCQTNGCLSNSLLVSKEVQIYKYLEDNRWFTHIDVYLPRICNTVNIACYCHPCTVRSEHSYQVPFTFKISLHSHPVNRKWSQPVHYHRGQLQTYNNNIIIYTLKSLYGIIKTIHLRIIFFFFIIPVALKLMQYICEI